jgi:hypothetical protein
MAVMRGVGRFLFWDYPRGGWQYDVMVGLILAFIFLMPRDIFHDQPKATNVVMLRGGFWIEPQTFNGVPQDQLVQKAEEVVRQRYKTRPVITSVEPIYDEAEQEVKGYMAFTKP